MTYKPFSIVVVPFPFTDKAISKKRPALVLSSLSHQLQTQHITLLMITSAKNSTWPSDYLIKSLPETGLSSPSIVRQKLFTIDMRLIMGQSGKLVATDQQAVFHEIERHLVKY